MSVNKIYPEPKFDSYIKDPIYKEINFNRDKWALDLISCKEVIRLQNIYQLGLAFKAFPSATNTRFIHSIGTFKIAQDFANHFDKQIFEHDRKIFLAAALLHDIGHGPFSHVFEKISNVLHEEYTKAIILDETTQLNQMLKKHNINPQDLIDVYNGVNKKKWISRLISSNVDADRIDYMLRDSYYLGTCYSTIDINFLIERSYLLNDDIYFSDKTLNVIESFLLGRFYMHQDIYNNKNTFTFEWALKSIFNRLEDIKGMFNLYQDKIYYYDLYEDFVNKTKPISLQKYLKLNDSNLSSFIDSLRVLNDDIINSFVDYFFNYEGIAAINFSQEELNNILVKTKDSKINSKFLYTEINWKGKDIYFSGEKNSVNIINLKNKTYYKFPFENFLQYKKASENHDNKVILINKTLIN